MSNNVFNLPTEKIELPSKGLLYPESSPLAKGYVEIRIPTAKEEDILTNTNYLRQGVAVDNFLKSITIDKEVNYDEMVAGDKDAIQVAARVLGYGKNYSFMYNDQVVTADLTTMEEVLLDESLITPHVNEFSFHMPIGKVDIKFKLLTGNDQKKIDEEVKGMKKIIPDYSADITMLFNHCITEVNGSRQTVDIRGFVSQMIMGDSREFRKYIAKVAPGYQWKANATTESGEVLEGLSIPYTVDFFWPRF